MRFLLTNDDGIDAEGLRALVAAVRELGDVSVVASERAYSCMGHAVTQDSEIRVTWRDIRDLGHCCVVTGTPADCVRLGVSAGIVPKPDWVLAGINHGGNLGVDIFYSGTLAAVREAAILGIPAIACSQYRRKDRPVGWARAIRLARRVLTTLLEQPARPGLHWNVNLPFLEPGAAEPAIRLTRIGLAPPAVAFELDGDDAVLGRSYHNAARYEARPLEPGTDVEHVFRGGVAITPLHLDMMHPASPAIEFDCETKDER